MKRNRICYSLSLILVFCRCFVFGAMAEELPENVPELTLNTEATATIAEEGGRAWFRFVPAETGTYAFYSLSDRDTYGYLYTSGENGLNEVACDDDGGTGNNFQIKSSLTAGTEYYLAARFYNGDVTGSFPVKIEVFTGLVVSRVGDSTIYAEGGDTVTLAVEATSQEGTVTYQWMTVDKNGLWTAIEGQTSASCSVTAAYGNNKYICYVTDGVTTETADFSINGETNLTVSAVSATSFTVNPDGSVRMEVQASSDSGQITYEWIKAWTDSAGKYNEQVLRGENDPACTVNHITQSMTVQCRVTSEPGTVSQDFYINISAPITVEAVGEEQRTVVQGGSETMSVTATSAAQTLSYQWYYNNQFTGNNILIDGATGDTYTAENIREETIYTCIVRNEYGETQSKTFLVSIQGDFSAYPTQTELSASPEGPFTIGIYASGNEGDEFTYQWYGPVQTRNDPAQPIAGETGNTLEVEHATAAGYYFCRVTNSGGIEKDVWTHVTILNDLCFSGSTSETEYWNVGDEVIISAEATAATGDITYQWYLQDEKNYGIEYAHMIEGATDPTYTVPGPQKDYYVYVCAATDIYGNTVFAERGVCFSGALSIQTVGENTVSTEPGGSANFAVSATGDGEMTYQWYARTYTNGAWGGYQAIPGAIQDSYTFENAQNETELLCMVRTPFTHDTREFHIYIETGFNLLPISSTDQYADLNATVTLETEPSGTYLAEGVSYQWYKKVSDAYGHEEYINIPGATSSSYTTEPVIGKEYYRCSALDAYSNSSDVVFEISVNNNFSASASGSSEVSVEAGQTATLEVTATADTGSFHYQWYEYIQDEYGDENIRINQATGASYTTEAINENRRYYCYVTDDYNNGEDVWFRVTVDSGLTAEADGSDELSIASGSTATLKVSASVNAGSIYYQWYEECYHEEGYWTREEIPDATKETYTTGAMNRSGCFYCIVTDSYGNSEEIEFSIEIENHLEATADGTTASYKYITIQPEESVPMKVNVSADDMTGVTYQWYGGAWDGENYYNWGNSPISGGTGDSMTAANVSTLSMYRCVISDNYGNSEYVSFYIYIDNQLRAEIAEGSTLSVLPDAKATLTVTASCAKGSLTYQWYHFAGEGSGLIPGSASATLTTEAVTQRSEYYCKVSDEYGNSRGVYFTVRIDNRLKVFPMQEEISVPAGEDAALEVQAICSKGALTYEWFVDYTKDETATGPVYTLANVTEPVNVNCRVHDSYENTQSAWFYLSVENHLTATYTATANGNPIQVLHEEDDENGEEEYITIHPGDQVTITCNASCDEGEDELTYIWVDGNHGEPLGSDSNTLILPEIQSGYVLCEISDKYGNRLRPFLSIRVDNNFSIVRNGTMFREAQEGSSISLSVTVTKTTGDIRITWYGPEGYMDDENTDTVTVTVSGDTIYTCQAEDDYGNMDTVEFYVTTQSQAPETLQLNREKTVSLQGSIRKRYIFTPSESGSYTLFSSGSSDPFVTLYAGDNEIDHKDDNGDDCNFRLTAELEAGTQYTFVVGDWDYESAGFTMTLVKGSEEPIIDIEGGYVLRPGQTARLPIKLPATVNVTSSNPAVISADGTTITAHQEGRARITATPSDSNYEIRYEFQVKSGQIINVPANLTAIESEAFAEDESIRFVNLSSSTKAVGTFAFDNSGLIQIVVPAADTRIAVSAFYGTRPTILCPENSLAEQIAIRYGYPFLYIIP